jgi:hypothetical protein
LSPDSRKISSGTTAVPSSKPTATAELATGVGAPVDVGSKKKGKKKVATTATTATSKEKAPSKRRDYRNALQLEIEAKLLGVEQ